MLCRAYLSPRGGERKALLLDRQTVIAELVQLRQAQKALEVIQRLTQDIRDASDQLKKLIGGIRPPGA